MPRGPSSFSSAIARAFHAFSAVNSSGACGASDTSTQEVTRNDFHSSGNVNSLHTWKSHFRTQCGRNLSADAKPEPMQWADWKPRLGLRNEEAAGGFLPGSVPTGHQPGRKLPRLPRHRPRRPVQFALQEAPVASLKFTWSPLLASGARIKQTDLPPIACDMEEERASVTKSPH